MDHLGELQAGSSQEAWEATQALLATYVDEMVDEARADRADEFSLKWQRRLRVLLMRDAGMVEDTPEDDDGHLREVQQEMAEDKAERQVKRLAKIAQQEDDRTLQEAMAGDKSSHSGAETERTREIAPTRAQYKSVQLRRVLLNGVAMTEGNEITVCGSQFEVVLQIRITNVAEEEDGNQANQGAGDIEKKRVKDEGDAGLGEKKEGGTERGKEQGRKEKGEKRRETGQRGPEVKRGADRPNGGGSGQWKW